LNSELFISFTEFGISIVFNAIHEENDDAPKNSSEVGKVIPSSFVQEKKALSSIVFKLFGITTSYKLRQKAKADSPMLSTLFGISIFLSFSQE
jgi:hypothetical protein